MSYGSHYVEVSIGGKKVPISYGSSCDCSGGKFFYSVNQCQGCGNGDCNEPLGSSNANQRRIWKSARVDSSLYTMNLASLSVRGGEKNNPKKQPLKVNWNQSSDRAVPSIETAYVPRNRTGHRPGGSGAAGPEAKGVDIKHNSYARYLARLKAGNIRTIKGNPPPQPRTGNKQFVFGIVTSKSCIENCY